ncbi:phage tail domain-containing protein [Staphylococcus pasteuri]|uniref:phage tail domain-containing protein n=1 Tax=Staphylococcus pasteuri TaxID=45972 RepID=UPI001E42F301|nr:phage tail domain-containing protein [Staphylococcus pasteuri]MCE3021006.1 phage tail family protein [Staphylococcus pasteuri]
MLDTIKVNNKTLLWLVVERGFKIPSFNFALETEEVAGRPGSIVKNRNLKEIKFELPLIVHNDYLSHGGIKTHDDVLNELVRFFNYEESVPLQFTSQDWYWNAYFEGPIELKKDKYGFYSFTISVVLADPYKYAVEGTKNTAISDQVSVVSTGTADSPVIVQARALKDSTSFGIYKGVNNETTDYFMIGKSEDANKVSKDLEPFIFNDEFNTNGIMNWAYLPKTSFGNSLDGGDAEGGKFGLSDLKESIYPTTWGTNSTTNWHGAGIYKSMGKSLEDFRIRLKVIVRQHAGIGPGKAFSYVVDENNRIMFSIGYVNTSVNSNNGQIVAYAYDEHGEAKRIYTRETPFKYHRIDNMHVFMYLERKGNTIKITSFKYDSGKDPNRDKPLDKDVKIIKDRGGFYQRLARLVRLYVGKSAKYNKYLSCNILGCSMTELLPKQNDVTPIVIKKGDLVTLDTKEKIVKINDEDALALKDFGSNYFNIESGYNELLIEPENTFDTVVKWQDRYL